MPTLLRFATTEPTFHGHSHFLIQSQAEYTAQLRLEWCLQRNMESSAAKKCVGQSQAYPQRTIYLNLSVCVFVFVFVCLYLYLYFYNATSPPPATTPAKSFGRQLKAFAKQLLILFLHTPRRKGALTSAQAAQQPRYRELHPERLLTTNSQPSTEDLRLYLNPLRMVLLKEGEGICRIIHHAFDDHLLLE